MPIWNIFATLGVRACRESGCVCELAATQLSFEMMEPCDVPPTTPKRSSALPLRAPRAGAHCYFTAAGVAQLHCLAGCAEPLPRAGMPCRSYKGAHREWPQHPPMCPQRTDQCGRHARQGILWTGVHGRSSVRFYDGAVLMAFESMAITPHFTPCTIPNAPSPPCRLSPSCLTHFQLSHGGPCQRARGRLICVDW